LRTAAGLGAAVLLCGLCSLAPGQNTPPPESVAADQSKIPETFFYPAPPAGVDPSTLSDAALADSGCSESTPISYVKLYGDYTLWFYDENIAH